MALVPSASHHTHRRYSSQSTQANATDHLGFSQLFTTALGSPFLTTPDLPGEAELVDGAPIYVPYAQTITRPPSPTPTADSTTFSFIYHDPDAPRTPLKAILPRIWHHISPSVRPMSFSFPPSPSPLPYASWRKSKLYSHDAPNSPVNYDDLEPLDGEEGELITVDDEACYFFDPSAARAVTGLDILALLPTELALHILILLCTDNQDWEQTPSLSNSRSSILPIIRQPYHALKDILACLAVSKTWRNLAADNTVWRALFLSCWSIDLTIKRSRDENTTNARTIHKLRVMTPPKVPPQPVSKATPGPSIKDTLRLKIKWKQRKMRNLTNISPSRLAPPQITGFQPAYASTSSPVLDINPVSVHRSASLHTVRKGPLQLNWYGMYRERMELERRWNGMAFSPAISSPIIEHIRRQNEVTKASRSTTPADFSTHALGFPIGFDALAPSPNAPQMPSYFTPHPTQPPSEALSQICSTYPVSFSPEVTTISGHTDSVYCLQIDSKRIITGSRDRTIKVWSHKGRLLGSFGGSTGSPDGTTSQGHNGSVLCLKFSPDWDRDEDKAEHQLKSINGGKKKGFMVSGSSDFTICVWSLCTGKRLSESSDGRSDDEREVHATVVDTLKGHTGGVLDLQMDEKWIVSCAKDASVRVWDRNTYEPRRVLRGHEGPVNAVGLQSGKVVSASGDGKMILWDINNGERIRTFEGHNRGLACIEFKDGIIVSGSNDCKIKVWSASTGACLCTFGGHDALVRALAFDPKTGRLVSTSYDKTVKVWNLFTGQLVQDFKNIHTSHIFDVKFDVSRIVSTSHDQKVVVLDFSPGLDTTFFA